MAHDARGVSSLYGGYWNFDVQDFCYMTNRYFPPPEFYESLSSNIQTLVTSYPSTNGHLSGLVAEPLGLTHEELVVGNGASAIQFHNRCNNKGPTYTVVRSIYGRLYGGYLNKSWSSQNNYIYDNKAFLYSLTHNQKYGLNHPQYAAYDRYNYGPTFGGGHDLYIADNMNYSYNYFGYSYKCPFWRSIRT